MPDAFLRRCFFHFIAFPDKETMNDIVDLHPPGIKARLPSDALDLYRRAVKLLVFFDVGGSMDDHVAVWLNPEPRCRRDMTPSIGMTRELMADRMFELTLNGIDQAMAALVSVNTPSGGSSAR